MAELIVISAAVEGDVDEAVARRLISAAGGRAGSVYGKSGKSALLNRIGGYNNAARNSPWIVLVDLNGDADCVPLVKSRWLPAPARWMCFRVAVRQVEAWLMADAETLAAYLGIARSRIPGEPEVLDNSKVELVNLARRSRKRNLRADLVPRERSGRVVGPAYSSRLIEYVETHWRPPIAANRSESLRRAMTCLERLIQDAA